MVSFGTILGFIVSKERKLFNSKKIQAFVNMHVPKNTHHIQVFNGMAQFYHFIILRNLIFILEPITKLTRHFEPFT
jgi:hypothetical protein